MAKLNRKDDAYNLRRIFEEMELDVVRSLRRNLKGHEREEEEEGFRWEMWQRAKLRNLQRYRKENEKTVKEISPDIERVVNEALEENYQKGQNLFSRIWDKIKSIFFKRKRVRFPQSISHHKLSTPPPREKDFFGVNDRKLQAMQETVSRDLKKAQHAVLRRMDDVYRKTVYNAQFQMAAGAKTLDQAIDLATKQFLEKGIDCIEYKNGRRMNIASYAEMALRTASHRAMLLGEGKKRDEWGIHTVVVSAHANTCPLCAPWQGKVLIDDIFSSGTREEAESLGYPLLSEAMRAGLLHPNCRHTISTYFPGITQLPEVPDTAEAINTYNAEQKQRELERKIRKWKRKEEGSCDPENLSYANKQVRRYQEELRVHLNRHPKLRRDYSREKTRGIPDNPKSFKAAGGKFDRGTAEWNLRRDDEAESYYKFTRTTNDDISSIAKNVGWTEHSVARIKQHVFSDKHILDDGTRRFDADYNMAVAWQRLINGDYLDRDILLLKHEYLESIIEKKYNLTYREAHDRATLKHDWNTVLEKEAGEYGEADNLHELIGKD